jgi:hypothetical protein
VRCKRGGRSVLWLVVLNRISCGAAGRWRIVFTGVAEQVAEMQMRDDRQARPTAVYSKKIWRMVPFMVLILLLFVLRVRSLAKPSPSSLIVMLALLGALVFVPLALEARRRIIITDSEIVSIPRTGPPVRVLLALVVSVEETTALWAGGRYASRIPAARLVLATGERVVIPLDFRERTEILERMKGLVAERGSSPARVPPDGPSLLA